MIIKDDKTLIVKPQANTEPDNIQSGSLIATPLLEGLKNDYTDIERTPGAVAVMGSADVGLVDEAGPTTTPETAFPATNSPRRPAYLSDPSDKCATRMIFTEDDNTHTFGKRLYCGCDWCKVCGQDGSKAHNRRIAHWLPKFEQFETMGYLVIEWPDSYRHNTEFIYSKAGLANTQRIVKDVLGGRRGKGNKRHGGYFSRGIFRWHWFGDRCINADFRGSKGIFCKLSGQPCPKNKSKCEQFENDGKLNQHLNIAVDGGYLDETELKALKSDLRKALDCQKLIISYDYFKTPGQMFQKLTYITRPTFHKREWDNYLAQELRGFRASGYWGNWKQEKIWEPDKSMAAEGFEAVSELHSGHCPECHAELHKWSKPVSSRYLEIWGAVEIGDTGYYRIPLRIWSGDDISPAMVRKLQELEQPYGVNFETGEIEYFNKRTVGGNYLPKDLADRRFNRFCYQHRVKIEELKLRTCQDFDETDYFDGDSDSEDLS